MIVYGYAKGYMYKGDGTLMIKVRIPQIHGPYSQVQYQGKRVRGYTQDDDLPYYPSVLLPSTPGDGEVVALTSMYENSTEFLVLGLTGGSYYNGVTNLGE